MAAPPHVTTKAMSGKFVTNMSLSDSSDEILRLQGVSWFKRRAVATFPAGFSIKHTTNEVGIELIGVARNLPGGIAGSIKNRILDGQEHEEDDDVLGPVTRTFRRIPVEEITDEFLKQDWTQDTTDNGIILTDSWSTPGKNSNKWTLVQAWGFAMVKGERRYVRRFTFTSESKKDGPIHVLAVLDYLGQI